MQPSRLPKQDSKFSPGLVRTATKRCCSKLILPHRFADRQTPLCSEARRKHAGQCTCNGDMKGALINTSIVTEAQSSKQMLMVVAEKLFRLTSTGAMLQTPGRPGHQCNADLQRSCSSGRHRPAWITTFHEMVCEARCVLGQQSIAQGSVQVDHAK